MENTEAIRHEVERKVSLGKWSQDDLRNFLSDFNAKKN